jgi:hypothetical protein
MKQNMILQILAILLVLHDYLYMPVETSMLTFLAALAMYGVTGKLLVPVVVLFVAPLILVAMKMYKQKDGFTATKAEEVSERVKSIKSNPGHHDVKGVEGVMENFETIDGSGSPVPDYVMENGRFLVVPEHSMPPTNSVDRHPLENPTLITGSDASSVNTALVPDATKLAPATSSPATAPSMMVGPSQA